MIYYKDYYDTPQQALAGAIWDRWVARCPFTGIELHQSAGNSRSGRGSKWFVFMPDERVSHYRPYAEWRYSFRAWSTKEAIEHALSNRKVQKWYKQAWQQEMNLLIGMG